jgi:hypothetical protein
VIVYKKLVKEFMDYKEFSTKELDLNEFINHSKDHLTENLKNEVRELKMALKIPRFHYKHIENARFENIIK